MKTAKLSNSIIISVAVVIILIYGKNLIMPFIIAVFIWFLIKAIRNVLNKTPFIKNKIHNGILNTVSFLVIFAILGGIAKILIVNITQLTSSISLYQANIHLLTNTINAKFNIDLVYYLNEFIGKYDYLSTLSQVFSSLTDIFSSAFLISIYVLFLLFEERYFNTKLQVITETQETLVDTLEIISNIERSIRHYISIKTLVSLLTGVVSYIALLFLGIDAPLFWAFLIFMMNYIPTIGSLIATLFPAFFALLQFGEIIPAAWTLAIIGTIQLIIGNLIDPKLTGDSLNISPLMVIIGLTFWGAIWGVIGMFLSVPITVMIILVFSEIPRLKGIATMMSKTGKIAKLHNK